MSKDALSTIAWVLVLVGFLLIVSSPEMGMAAANRWLQSVGSSNHDIYLAMADGWMGSFRVLGAVLLGGGIVGLFAAGLKSAV